MIEVMEALTDTVLRGSRFRLRSVCCDDLSEATPTGHGSPGRLVGSVGQLDVVHVVGTGFYVEVQPRGIWVEVFDRDERITDIG